MSLLSAIKKRITGLAVFHKHKYNYKYLYFTVFLIPLVFNPFVIKVYEIPKQSWMMVFIGIFLLAGVIVALAAGKWEMNINKWLYAVVGLWLLSYALSTIFAVAPIEAFWGDYEKMSGFLTNFYYILHFLICLRIFTGQKEQDIFINMAVILGCVLSLHAFLQWLRIDPFQFGNIDEFSGRSYATIGQPSLFGQWLIAPLFAAGFRITTSEKKRKNAYIIAAILIGGGLLLSLNRASILAITITLGLILLYKHKMSAGKKIAVLSAAVAIGIILVILFGGPLRSFHTRINLWESSLPLVTNNLIIGSGPESFYQTIQTVLTKDIYLTETMYTTPGNVHLEALQVMLDRGLLGLLLYLTGIIFLGWVFFKEKATTPNAKIALFTLIASIISLQFSFAEISQIIYMLALWAILLLSVIKFKPVKSQIHISIRLTVFILIACFSGFSFYHSYSICGSNQLLTAGVEQFFKDSDQSFNLLEEAARKSPNYAYLHYTAVHFLATDEIKKFPEKVSLLQENVKKLGEITDQSFKYHISSAKLNLATANHQASYKAYQKAAQKAPNNPVIYQEWGNAAYAKKDYAQAIQPYEKLMNSAPYFWKPPTPTQTNDPDYTEKHRIFKKTHELFYDSMINLVGAYGATYDYEKAEELINLIK